MRIPGPERLRTSARNGRGSCCAWLAALAVLGALLSPSPAYGFRRGLASSEGAATLASGQVVWVRAGYPGAALGWGIALHPVVDLLLAGEVTYRSPTDLSQELVGGGATLECRFGIVRGRASVAVSARLGATIYAEGLSAAALLDIVSPGVLVSLRLGETAALHAGARAIIHYRTLGSDVAGGFEAIGGVTVCVYRQLALVGRVSAGATLWNAEDPATARLAALVGLEYRFGRPEPLP